MAIFADPNSFKGFDDLIRKKQEEVAKKAAEKVNNLEPISDLNRWDGDSSEGRATNAEGVRLGGTHGVALDAYETPKYNAQGQLIPYLGAVAPTEGKRSKKWDLHRASYSKMSGVPVEQVTQEMLNNEGLRQAQVLQSTIAEGQGHYQPNTGKVLRNPLIDPVQQAQDPKQAAMDALLRPRQKELSPGNFEAFDPQVLANSQGTGYFGRALESYTNPVTGENINEVLNTPEQNASFDSKYNSKAAMREADSSAVLRHARNPDYDENDLTQTETIPEDVKKKGKPGRVDLITNKDGFSVYYPERENKAGFYKDDLTLSQAQKWRDAIEANPEAEYGATDWMNAYNELISGGVTVIEGVKRSMDVGPMSRKEGVSQWNDYVIGTHEPVMDPTGQPVDVSENPVSLDERISEADQAKYLEIFAKQQLGTELTKEDTAFTETQKFDFLDGLDAQVQAKLARDAESLSTEQAAADKVNRRKSGYEAAMAEEIYQDSGWDYLVYSLGNRKVSAAHSLVESAAFMGQLMVPYVGMASAITAGQENFKREYQELHGEVPEGKDLALLNSMAVISTAVEKLGVKAITGRLPGLTKWVSEIGIKSPLLANVVKPISAVLVPASIEGISGLTSTTAETIAKHGIEDGSVTLPTGFEASEAFVNEAMAGGVMTTTVNSGKLAKDLIVGPDIKKTAEKISKRNAVLQDDTLSDKQRTVVETSRNKLVNDLVNKREKLSLKSFKEYKDSEQQLIEVDAYLDELNGIALRSMGISSEQTDITTAADLSYRIVEQLKKVNDTTDAEKNATRRRIIAGLEKGLKQYRKQAGIDNSLAKVGNFQSNDKEVINAINMAKARAVTRLEADHSANVDYITQDYAELTAKEPHKEGLFNTQRDEAIQNLTKVLQEELAEIGDPIKAGVIPTQKEKTQAKSDSVESFVTSEKIDVKSTNYSPKDAVLTLLKGTTTSEVAKDPQAATELLRHSKNLDIQIQKLKDTGKTETELEDLIGVRDAVAPLIEEVQATIAAQKSKSKVVESSTDQVLYSLDPKQINTEEVIKLNDAELTEEQKELKALQIKRAALDAKRADKNVADVHEEIMFGDNDNKRSFTYYENAANSGLNPGQVKQLDNFVAHMQVKSEKLSAAYADVQNGPDEVIWVSKTDKDAPVIRQAVEGVDMPSELEYENLDKPDQVTSHYKLHKNSGNFVEQVKTEAEYGNVTQEVINKVIAGKKAIAKQNVETFTEKDIKEIQGLIKSKNKVETVDLDALAESSEVKEEEVKPEVDINTVVATTTPTKEEEKDETVQTESVKVESVTKETTPVKEIKPEVIKPSEINFEEDTNTGYAARTRVNASADATIAIAVTFSSAGERLTKREVENQGKLYLPIDVSEKLSFTKRDIANIVDQLNSTGATSLNIAGNGIYSMKGKYTQERVDAFTFGVLKAINEHPDLVNPITSVRSGGQSGFDEAGAKAGAKLGLPTTVLAPKGWKFRNIDGKDISNNKAFTERFNTKQTKTSEKPEVVESVQAKPTKKLIPEVTEVKVDGTVAKPGNTILKQYDGKFPQVHTSQTEGDVSNVTNYFESKNKKHESIATVNETGGVTRELILEGSTQLVNKINTQRKAKGQEDITATKDYANLIANTFESFKTTYEAQGPKVVTKKNSTGEGAYLKEILSLLHIENEKGNAVLPDEVLLAAATEAIGWLTADANRLDWKTDDQIKSFLGLDNKDKLTNEERDVVVDMGTPVYQVATDLGKRIMNTLNLKAMKDTKYSTNKSPLELQERMETSLGLLALGLLTEVDASEIYNGLEPNKGPFVLLAEVKPKGLERSPDLNEQSISTLKLNTAHSKETIGQVLKDLRSENAHLEALTGAQVSKNGVYGKPVLSVQTSIRGSLSKVSQRNQKLIKRLQGVPQAGKKGELRLWNALELDAKKKLAGYENVKPKHTERQESFKAANDALINEIRIVDNYDGEEFYYEYGLQKQDRMMIKSSGINPMNSKIHRHLFANGGITSTVNNDRMRNTFKIAVAAAFGIAIDKQVAQKSVDAFDEIMADPIVKKALEVIKNSNSTDAELQAAILDVNKAYGNKVHLLEGLAALEVYDADKSFDTNITVEIDGITNGYAIGLLQFGGPNLRKDLERVGVFFNDEEYGSWLSKKQNVDVYQELATQMASARTVPNMVNYYVSKYAGKAWPKWHKNVIDRLSMQGQDNKAVLKPEIFSSLDVLHGEIFDDQKLTSFARSLAKDPLMTTNYGAALGKVLSKMTDDAIDVMYDSMAEIQQEFNTGDKVKAEIDARRLDNALSVLMGKPAESFGLVSRMQSKTLQSATLTKAESKILAQSIGFIYEPMLSTGLDSLLGTIDDGGKSLMSRRTEVTQAYEWVYTGYKRAYDNAIAELGVKSASPEQKREVAISLLNTFFPQYKGPWADVDTFIDILGKEAVKHDDVTVELARDKANVKVKQPKSQGDRWVADFGDQKSKKTLNTAIRSFDPASPGAKAIVNMVQNMDAALIGSVSEKLDFLTLYDAGMFALKDLDRASEIYNNSFIELNKSHRFLDQALDVLNKLDAELGKEKGSLQAVTKAYRANSHQAKNTNKDNIKYLNLKTQIKSLENIIKDVNEEMKILDGIVKVNQLYWADVDKVTPNNDIHTEEGLHSIKVDVNAQINNIFEMGSVGSNTLKIFDFFGKRAKKHYSSPEMYREQALHLEEVLQQLIIPSVGVLDNLSIEVNSTNTFAHGSYNNKHVRINVNTNAPATYTESAGQEVYVHEMIHAVTQVGLNNDRKINRDVRVIYDMLREGDQKITWQDFMHPEVLHDIAAEEKTAKAMYEYIFGQDSNVGNELHEFMAYALSNPNLMRKLKTMKPIRTKDTKAKNLLESFFLLVKRMVNGLQKSLGLKKVPKNVHDQMFNLAKEIVNINMDKRGVVAKFLYNNGIGTKYNQINNLLIDTIDKASNKGLKTVDKKLDKRRAERNANPSTSRIVQTVKNIENIPALGIKLVANEEAREAIINIGYKVRGRSAALIRSLFGELAGITPQQFLDEVLKSTHMVDGGRRATKEMMTDLLKKSFVSKTEPTHLQLTAITRLLLKTDASTLLHGEAYDMADIMKLFKDPKYLAAEIRKYRKTLNITSNGYYENAVDGLSDVMVFGETVIHDQSMNAYNIANLPGGKAVDEANLDTLVTLVAISKTINSTKGVNEAFIELADAEFAVNTDNNGIIDFLLHHRDFKVKSLNALFTEKGKDHRGLMSKGYISKLHDADAQLVVEPVRVPRIDPKTGKQVVINGIKQTEDNIAKMEGLGYKMIDKLTGIDGLDNDGLAMFHSTTIMETGRTKGIASVTARKPFGTSLKSIIARNPLYKGQVKATLGRFLKEEADRAEAQKKTGKGNKTKKALIPVRNNKGKIVDYRIALSHNKAEVLLEQDLDAINVLSHMFSHMVDKDASQKTNAHIVKVLAADEKLHHTKKNTDKWVNILDAEHYAEYYESFPKQMRHDISENASIDGKGNRVFYVQEKLLDVAFGFKQATIENVLPKNKIGRRTGWVEKMWQRLVSSAVVNIVVKIPDVTIANIESNFFTSIIHGASPTYITKTMQQGWVEMESYRDSMKELNTLQQKIAARPTMLNNPQVKRKLAKLSDSINNSPMHMFMDAGLFTSITEDIHVNEQMTKKSLPGLVKKHLGLNVPKTLTQVAKAGYLTSDNVVGKAMMHTLQASDFLARYALYKWKTEKKGMSHDKAWKIITRTFIVYDKPLNRDLQYMNDMGLFMFIRYWLRIQPVVANLVREKPANIAMYLAAEGLLDIDTPDIIDSSFLDGKILPTDGGISKVLKEVIIPPAWEIATGKSW